MNVNNLLCLAGGGSSAERVEGCGSRNEEAVDDNKALMVGTSSSVHQPSLKRGSSTPTSFS